MIRLVSLDKKVEAQINPTGAALSSLMIDGVQVVGAPDRFSGVMLFPWPNRISGGQWEYQGMVHSLPLNEHNPDASLHGLVFDRTFEINSQSADSCQLTLGFLGQPGYPFDFKLQVDFLLSHTDLKIVYSVTNRASEVAPFAIGFHPYFAATEDSKLQIGSDSVEIQGVHLDDTFGPKISRAHLASSGWSVDLESTQLDYFHVFTNRYDEPGKLWLAIEPQSGPANSLATKSGVVFAEPGKTHTSRVSLRWP